MLLGESGKSGSPLLLQQQQYVLCPHVGMSIVFKLRSALEVRGTRLYVTSFLSSFSLIMSVHSLDLPPICLKVVGRNFNFFTLCKYGYEDEWSGRFGNV